MYYVYLLELKNGKIYTGYTSDLVNRIKDHNDGRCVATMNLRPVKLIWHCVFNDRLTAMRFETYLKTGSGQAFRNKRLTPNY